MADHDLLCPQWETDEPPGSEGCRCGIIMLARDNERARLIVQVEALRDMDHPYLGSYGPGWTDACVEVLDLLKNGG